MKRFAMLLAVLVMLWLAASASAMNSTNYALDWFTPLTTGGGGPASSANYAVNFSVGQTTIGSESSSSYRAGLGYWAGWFGQNRLYLPLVLKG